MRSYVTYLVKIDRPAADSVVPESLAELRGDDVFVDGRRLGRLPYYPRQLVREGGWVVADLRVPSAGERPNVICSIAKGDGAASLVTT